MSNCSADRTTELKPQQKNQWPQLALLQDQDQKKHLGMSSYPNTRTRSHMSAENFDSLGARGPDTSLVSAPLGFGEDVPAHPARCWFPTSLVTPFHHRWRTRSSAAVPVTFDGMPQDPDQPPCQGRHTLFCGNLEATGMRWCICDKCILTGMYCAGVKCTCKLTLPSIGPTS